MRSLVLDTNGQVKELEQSGFSRTQAEGITSALNNLDSSGLTTKSDLLTAVHQLELALEKQTMRLTVWYTGALFAQAAFVIAVLQYLQ